MTKAFSMKVHTVPVHRDAPGNAVPQGQGGIIPKDSNFMEERWARAQGGGHIEQSSSD